MISSAKKQWLLVSLLFLINTGTFVAAHASDVRAHILQTSDLEKSGEYVRQHFLKQLKKPFSADKKQKKMLVIGDRHAQN